MFKLFCYPMLALLGLFLPYLSEAQKIKVVATIPDVADMTARIGGEFVDISTLATGVENPHSVPMKPSFIVLLNRADVVVAQGLGLEHAFLPGLLDAARNPKILPGQNGYIDCSVHVTPLDIPTRIDRAEGEQHPEGNPHFNLNPEYGRDMAKAIAEGLSLNFPEHKENFTKNLTAYLGELDSAIARWKQEIAPLQGVKFVSFHPDMNYLAAFVGMIQVGTIELKPGIDPTPSHIAELKEKMKSEKVSVVLRERHYPAELAQSLAGDVGASVIDVIVMTKGVPEAKDYISFIDYNIRELLSVVKK